MLFILVLSMMLVPVTYFLATSNSASFIPTYLVCFSLILLFRSEELASIVERNKNQLIVLSTFLLYMCFSSIRMHNLEDSAKLFGYSVLILTFVCASPLLNQAFTWFVPSFLNLLVACATISSILSVLGYFHFGIQTAEGSRLVGMGGLDNPVLSALSYGPISIICACLALKANNLSSRLAYVVCFLAIFTALVLAGTRSAFLGLLFALPLVAYFNFKRSYQRRSTAQWSTIVLGCIFALTLLLGIINFEALTQRSLSFRPEIWQATLFKFQENNIWFGSGLTSDASVQRGQLIFNHPHSIYIATLFYGGIIGLGGLFLVLATTTKHLLSNIDRAHASLALALLVFGVISLAVDGNRIIRKIDFVWLTIWLPISLGMVYSRSPKVEIEE